MIRYLRRSHASLGMSGTLLAAVMGCAAPEATRETASGGITVTDVMKQVLPAGDFRNVEASIVELAPGAAAALHRHDVALLAYVLEGTIENRFNGGAALTHRTGESWWEAPGTVHDVARNPSTTARTRFLVVYIGEEGKPRSVRLDSTGAPVPLPGTAKGS